ncbi:MAG TPA: uridine kinase [Dehalococcoidia bacterium]|jgi:uridine kinase|nr:uridine kinase [Dehalococcoidia bacterium]HIK88026.1 uridine kinase [Dehalococcoidia bacterium]
MSESQLTYSSFEGILDAVRAVALKHPDTTLLVGVDGAAGSGKSKLAKRLAESFDDATVVHIDDFADWNDDSNWVLSTFAERVLAPLVAGITSKHQRYDWPTDSLGEWFEIPATGIAIVEGVTALRSDLRDYWQVGVWVDCPRELRLERGVARDGEGMRSKWEDLWMPGEDEYVRSHEPENAADFIFDGSGGS